MKDVKVIHLHFNGDGESCARDCYYGSLKAIYEEHSSEAIGIKYSSLLNAVRGKEIYENKKVVIRIGKLRRKPKTQ